ncbi:MAG: hypothetical protein LBD41_02390 [Clostridiales Family XIII bacterium]|jgi:hypothetical protein|nr:hypothetical protein [Clostridiales Family XIII bacterium]
MGLTNGRVFLQANITRELVSIQGTENIICGARREGISDQQNHGNRLAQYFRDNAYPALA